MFAAEVSKRAAADPRVAALEERIDHAEDGERGELVVELAELRAQLRADKIAEVAAEFDDVHDIHRAVEVGSVDEVIAASDLRPKVVEVIEQGLAGHPDRKRWDGAGWPNGGHSSRPRPFICLLHGMEATAASRGSSQAA